MKDSLFGLDKETNEDGMKLLETAYGDVEVALVCGILDDEQIPYLTKDRGSGGVVRVFMGNSLMGTDILVPEEKYEDAKAILDAYKNAPAEEIDGESDESEKDSEVGEP